MTGCDLDWEENANKAFQAALEHEKSGKWDQARKAYEEALQHNPYHQDANRNLGYLMEHYFFDDSLAITYYTRYLDLQHSNRQDRTVIERALRELITVRDGVVENPLDAATDLLDEANRPTRRFFARLHPEWMHQNASQGISPELIQEEWKKKLAHKKKRFVYREHHLLIKQKKGPSSGGALVEVDLVKPSGEIERWDLLFKLSSARTWRLSSYRRARK